MKFSKMGKNFSFALRDLSVGLNLLKHLIFVMKGRKLRRLRLKLCRSNSTHGSIAIEISAAVLSYARLSVIRLRRIPPNASEQGDVHNRAHAETAEQQGVLGDGGCGEDTEQAPGERKEGCDGAVITSALFAHDSVHGGNVGEASHGHRNQLKCC